MSIKISSRKSAPLVITPSRPAYTNEDDEKDVGTFTVEEEESQHDKGVNKEYDDYRESEDNKEGTKDYDDDYDYKETNNEVESEAGGKDENYNDKSRYENGVNDDDTKASAPPKKQPVVPPKTTQKPMHIKPTSVAPALLHKREKVWPPPAPKTYDAFAVEGHGRMNPYTGQLIPDEEEKPEPEEDKRLEIDEGHTAPVHQLRKNWQGRKTTTTLGVQRPSAAIKGEADWIKHVKPQVEYEEPPKEPPWLQLVRNRRWNSTVKARFPCRTDDIVEFERRSTTPKNWKRLLLDKKAVRTIGQITGIGAEGEELLWRLAKQRGKVEGETEIKIPGEQDLLAYEHVKGNLEAAVAEAAIHAMEGSEAGDDDEAERSGQREGGRRSSPGRRTSSTSSHTTVSPATIRQRLLRLHPEEFKKILALDRARDAHLRWQFSTDPYDSLHEHQLQPFEIALLSGERENRLRQLLRKLLRAEDMPASVNSSGTSTPLYGRQRGRSLPGSSYTSDQESDSGSSVSSQKKPRPKKKPPAPAPRRGRSASPSPNNEEKDIVHGFLGADDEQISSELKKLEEMAKGMGLPKEITDLLGKSAESPAAGRKERPADSVSVGLDDRKRNLLPEREEKKIVSSHNEKIEPINEISRSLADRKMSFLDEAEKARSYKKVVTSDDETDTGRGSEIDAEEISSRRNRFLNQEREAQEGRRLPEKSKARHKVQRIKSDAELYAVLSKRRMATDDEDTATEEPSAEMKGLVQDITNAFGDSEKGRREPRYQSGGDSEVHRIEDIEEGDDDANDDDEDAPTRRSRRIAKADAGRQARQRARKWSESEESDDEQEEARVKNFADQRIRVKAKGRHAATRNPVKQLQDREDLRSDTDEYLSVGSSGSYSDVKLVGRNKVIGTGKRQERKDLHEKAKKGLESREDIKGASQGLKKTEKNRSGVSKERINQYDGVKPVMLFQVKGARNVQTRLVEPSVDSMNSGDVFVLVTPKQVHQWNGKFCSIMEKARGTEITSVIQQWKEMNCEADSINVMDQGRERETRATKAFWSALGGKGIIKDKDDVIEDSEYEKGILESTKLFEVEENDDGDTELISLDEYSGKVPSKKWLSSEKAYVLDFGSEVYTWIGRECKGRLRKMAVDHGIDVFEEDFRTSATVNPLFPNKGNPTRRRGTERPEWAVFGKMTEKSENVLFRRKFFDWPDPVDLKPKTSQSIVHEKLTRDVNDYQTPVELQPIDGNALSQEPDGPIMIVNEMLIGRGKGGKDPETLFKYAVQTNEIKVWRIVEKTSTKIPEEEYGFFFSAESYIVRWSFQYMRTGIRNIKGGKSKQEDIGRDCLLYFYWQGKDCTVADKGTAALMMSEIDSDEGPQMLVMQGQEPPAFYQLFDNGMVVNLGRQSDDAQFKNTRMYFVRNEGDGETCMVEIPVTSANLRSRGSIIICDPPEKTIFLWHGIKASEDTQNRAIKCAKGYREKVKLLYQKKFKIKEMTEGEEEDEFWDALGDDEDYVSYLGVSKEFDFTIRCFSFASLHNEFVAKEITSSTYLPGAICPFPLLQENFYNAQQPALFFIDAKYKMFLWQGWWPVSDEEHEEEVGPTTAAEKHRFDISRKLAMQSVVSYAEAVGRPISKAYIIYAGLETLEFKNLFPHWEDEEEIADLMRKAGKKKSGRLKLESELEKLQKECSK